MNTFKLKRMQKKQCAGAKWCVFIYSGWRLYQNNEDDILLIIFISFLNDKFTRKQIEAVN